MAKNKKEKVITDFWACQRPMGQYRGIYPGGILKRIDQLIGLKNKKVLHLFAGRVSKINKTDITIEINPKFKPDIVGDCKEKLPLPNNQFNVVLADPPYDSDFKIYGKKLYGTPIVKPYSFIREAVRVCKPEGFICILHQLVYITPKQTRRWAVIGVSTGPNMRVRALNIFKKQTHDTTKN